MVGLLWTRGLTTQLQLPIYEGLKISTRNKGPQLTHFTQLFIDPTSNLPAKSLTFAPPLW